MHIAHKKGFTLIEVLIVVAVIGILASVVLVGLGPVQRQGRDARRISDLRQVQNALELHFNAKGVYPTANDWAALSTALTGAGIGVSSIPNDPKPGANYLYATDGVKYVLGATLEDTSPANPHLAQDVDTNPIAGGFNCADPVYCVQL